MPCCLDHFFPCDALCLRADAQCHQIRCSDGQIGFPCSSQQPERTHAPHAYAWIYVWQAHSHIHACVYGRPTGICVDVYLAGSLAYTWMCVRLAHWHMPGCVLQVQAHDHAGPDCLCVQGMAIYSYGYKYDIYRFLSVPLPCSE